MPPTSPRLNMVIAAEATIRKDAETTMTKALQALKQGPTFSGVIKTYQPEADAGGEQLPEERQKVVRTVPETIAIARDAWIRLFDITATKVYANRQASANITIGDQVILPNVPVEFLLFLEKRLDHVLQLLNETPVLDPAINWDRDDNDPPGVYRAPDVVTIRTKKVPRVIQLSPATDRHQATTQLIEQDESVGRWHRIQLSGAAQRSQIETWRQRALALQAAVRMAREEANSIEAPRQEVGQTIMDFVFGQISP